MGCNLSGPVLDGMHGDKNLSFKCQVKFFIPPQHSTAVAVATKTDSPCTPTSQPVELADDEVIPT